MIENKLDKNVLSDIYKFVNEYGIDALNMAMHNYTISHKTYICGTKTSIKRIPIYTINYIEIFGHNIVIHTINGKFTKYGTLKGEYEQLKKFGFVKCNQSFLVPVDKIVEIKKNYLILTTGNKFKLSRSCATEAIYTYVKYNT